MLAELEEPASAPVETSTAPTEKESRAVRQRIKQAIIQRAAAGRGNPAFERLMRAALNSRTDQILGWKKPSRT